MFTYIFLGIAAYIAMQSHMIVGFAIGITLISGGYIFIGSFVAVGMAIDANREKAFRDNLESIPYKKFFITTMFIAMLVIAFFPTKQTMLAVVVVPFAAIKDIEVVEYFKGPVGEYLDLLLKTQIDEMKQSLKSNVEKKG
jgi:hypothetical protein